MTETKTLDIPQHYPDWLKEFFNAPTDDLPGYISDWWDCGVMITEDERSLTCYSIPDIDEGPNEEPDVTFYGDQMGRRQALLKWMGGEIIAMKAAKFVRQSPQEGPFMELPLRLFFSEKYGNDVFGGPWQ